MVEQKTVERVKVNMMFAHHHLGDVLDMVAQGKVVLLEHATKKKIVAVVMLPTEEDLNADFNTE